MCIKIILWSLMGVWGGLTTDIWVLSEFAFKLLSTPPSLPQLRPENIEKSDYHCCNTDHFLGGLELFFTWWYRNQFSRNASLTRYMLVLLPWTGNKKMSDNLLHHHNHQPYCFYYPPWIQTMAGINISHVRVYEFSYIVEWNLSLIHISEPTRPY